ncbi:hypothetical protein ABIF44_000858 [Bradyrhizobium japonicum]
MTRSKKLHRGRLSVPFGDVAHPDRRERAIVQHCQMREQIKALEHHADFATHRVDVLEVGPELDAVDDNLALLKLLQRIDAADQRRLAGARGAADHDALALADLEVDVAQHVKLAVPFVEAGNLDDGV